MLGYARDMDFMPLAETLAVYAPNRNPMLFMLPRWNYAISYASIIGKNLNMRHVFWTIFSPAILKTSMHN